MNGYPGRVRTSVVGLALGICALGVGAVIVLIDALVPTSQVLPSLDAPAEEGAAPPGEVVCPGPHELTSAGQATSVGASLLIDCSQAFDGRTVSYRGEVIDAVLYRGSRAWVQLNDDPYSGEAGPLPESRTAVGGNSGLAVSVPRSTAKQIRHVGSYDAQGDIIAVVGVFRAADPADGGAPTIQARRARVVRFGHMIAHPVSTARVVTAAVTTLAATIAAALLARRRGFRWGVRRR